MKLLRLRRSLCAIDFPIQSGRGPRVSEQARRRPIAVIQIIGGSSWRLRHYGLDVFGMADLLVFRLVVNFQ